MVLLFSLILLCILGTQTHKYGEVHSPWTSGHGSAWSILLGSTHVGEYQGLYRVTQVWFNFRWVATLSMVGAVGTVKRSFVVT